MMWTARRTACLFAALLVVATVASRVPFVAHTTAVDHDGAHFALALERFDLLHKQPHPPGYLLFLAPAAALHQLGLPSLSALVSASVAFSVVGVLATWRLGQAMFGPRAGAAAAVLLLSSPLYWSRGELPLSYTAEVACQAVLGWALWRAMAQPRSGLLRAGTLLGLAAGVRQDLVLFVGPVAVWVARGAARGAAAAAAALAIAAALLWAVPLIVLSGGLEAYLAASRLQADAVHPYTVLGSLANLRTNARLVVTGLAWLGGAGWLVPIVWFFCHEIRRGAVWTGRAAPFLVVWVLPPLVFLGLVFAKLDYVLTVAPAVAVVLGAAVATLASRARTGWAVLAALAAMNAALFAFWPGGHEDAMGYRDIAAGDELVAGYRDEVLRQFDPRDVVLLVPADSALDFRTAMLELPGYAVYGIDFDAPPAHTFAQAHVSTYPLPSGGSVVPLAVAVRTIVWLSGEPPDPDWALASQARATAGGLPYFVVGFPPAEQSLRLGAYQLVRAPSP